MVVITCGCSNTYGSEVLGNYDHDNKANPSYAYGAHLARKLNADYINLAKPGISNSLIVYSVIDWITTNCIQAQKYKIEVLIVVVGWTEGNRHVFKKSITSSLQTPILTKSYLKTHLAYKNGGTWLDIVDPTKEFSRVCYEYMCDSNDDTLHQIFIMLGLDAYMRQNNIKYFTFPTLPIKNIGNYEHLLSALSPTNNYLLEDKTFNIIDKFLNHLAHGFHLNLLGHIKLANWVYEQLAEKKIIEKTCTS